MSVEMITRCFGGAAVATDTIACPSKRENMAGGITQREAIIGRRIPQAPQNRTTNRIVVKVGKSDLHLLILNRVGIGAEGFGGEKGDGSPREKATQGGDSKNVSKHVNRCGYKDERETTADSVRKMNAASCHEFAFGGWPLGRTVGRGKGR